MGKGTFFRAFFRALIPGRHCNLVTKEKATADTMIFSAGERIHRPFFNLMKKREEEFQKEWYPG
jgi:hypothetical protein